MENLEVAKDQVQSRPPIWGRESKLDDTDNVMITVLSDSKTKQRKVEARLANCLHGLRCNQPHGNGWPPPVHRQETKQCVYGKANSEVMEGKGKESSKVLLS